MKYSELAVIDKREHVLASGNVLQFVWRWVKGVGGKGTLQITLPSHAHKQLCDMCKSIETISGIPFSVSNLVSFQLQELIKKQEMEQNVFALKKAFVKIEDATSIVQKGKRNAKVLISLPKNQIYSVECILFNMEEELGQHNYKVEKVIQLLLTDVLRQIAMGKMQKVVESLLLELGVERKEIKEYVSKKEILI
ncbi:hypothetical protein COA01_23265 [Bacillus cereus]|uniref:hypothetical protein n=1 Tax=Bacillus cereus TaxID=1396 RepID=UPI000BFC1000|nr:hypothetical protein [Bacillus cereus]PGP18665.1 hypothetical protein COA01_23265 [Bacillus cereus]